jgi:hypothetical protein
MNKDTYINDLDDVLNFLNSKKKGVSNYRMEQEPIYEIIKKRGSKLYQILNKLEKDGYIDSSQLTESHSKTTGDKEFTINYDGKLFLLLGGYKKYTRNVINNRIWVVAKIIANALNAVGILIIGYLSYDVSKDSKLKDNKIDSLEKELKEKESIIKKIKPITNQNSIHNNEIKHNPNSNIDKQK